MKKKMFSILLTVLMVVALLSGCKADSSKSDNVVSTSTSETNTTDNSNDPGLQSIITAGKLKVGCKVDVPSFGLQNTATGEYEGLEIDIAYKIAAEIFGVTPEEAKEKGLVEFQGVTAKTRGPLLENGEINLVAATFTITEERKESWNFSTPYIEDALGLMSMVDAGYETVADLDGAIIGVAQGATSKDAIKAYITNNGFDIEVEFQEFDGYPALSAALSSGNIDIFSVDRAILAGYNNETTMILPDRFGTQEYGIATSLAATELTELVDKVVKNLISSGEMATMISDWGIE
jgi:putative glutamine transport system substrate-binding protein